MAGRAPNGTEELLASNPGRRHLSGRRRSQHPYILQHRLDLGSGDLWVWRWIDRPRARTALGVCVLDRDEITGDPHVLVVGLHHLLQEATDLGLPAKPPYSRARTPSWLSCRNPFGRSDPIGPSRYAIPVIVLRIREGQDGFLPDRLDQADTEDWRGKARRARHSPWSDLRGSSRDGSILDLRPPQLTGKPRSGPDADQDIVWTSPPVPGVASTAGTMVEDGAESLPYGEGSLEGGVSPREDSKLIGGKTRKGAVKHIGIVWGLREKGTTYRQT